jgi:hypothetical protein
LGELLVLYQAGGKVQYLRADTGKMTRFDFCYVSNVVFTCFKPAAGQLLASPLQLPSPEKSWMRGRAGPFLFSTVTFSLVRTVILGRGVVYSPSWDKKRAKTIYKTIDLERSCTVQTRQGMEDLVGDLLPIVQTKLQNLCKLYICTC